MSVTKPPDRRYLGSYGTGWTEGVDLDELERFRISIGGGLLADLEDGRADSNTEEVAA